MRSLQEVFDQIQMAKREQKEIKEEYRDALSNANEYEEILEKLEELKQRKKQIETAVQAQLGNRFTKLEDLKNDIQADNIMLNDIAISTLMDGKTVEVVDEYNHRYEPVFKVSFKKTSAFGEREENKPGAPAPVEKPQDEVQSE